MGELNIVIYCALVLVVGVKTDKSCVPRQISGQSVICVCTADYCDEITWEAPAQGKYIAYISSEAGSRFQKTTGDINNNSGSEKCAVTLTLDPDTKYQFVEGFGGAVTDAAGINWKNLSDASLMQKVIDSYYSKTGLEYNMIRVPIGGCDFSTHPYAYNEYPENDTKLSNFSLTSEDYDFKIPMIKAILAAATDDVHIVATTWSPPTWMKTNNNISGFSLLRTEYYQTYADYHVKFLEEYEKENVHIWAITTTNEPTNGAINAASFNSLGWSPNLMGKWIIDNLGPTIRNSKFKDLKILTSDDQRLTIPIWFNAMIELYPKTLDFIDGVAVHYYTDMIVPASVHSFITKDHADKFILYTEACEGSKPWQKEKVFFGSWGRARNYIVDIMDNMNHHVVGWIDWNLCLNAGGGPNWSGNFVDSTIIVFPEKKEFIKQPMFYAIGHFSKFVPRGSQRIEVKVDKSLFTAGVDNLAFLTPRNTIVTVIYNSAGARNVCIKLGNETTTIAMEAESIVTVEMPYKA